MRKKRLRDSTNIDSCIIFYCILMNVPTQSTRMQNYQVNASDLTIEHRKYNEIVNHNLLQVSFISDNQYVDACIPISLMNLYCNHVLFS